MNGWRGSLTIEAALVVPLVLALFAFAMKSGIQMYTECSDTSRNVTVPYMAMLMRSQGKSDTSISTALRQDGYSSAEIAQILQQMRR